MSLLYIVNADDVKTKLIILSMLIFPIVVSGQIIPKDTDECKLKIPDFKGILEILNDTNDPNHATCISPVKHFQILENAANNIKQETGVVRFIVNPDGTLSGFTILKSAGPELDTEFIGFIKIIDKMAKSDSLKERPAKVENDSLMLPVMNSK